MASKQVSEQESAPDEVWRGIVQFEGFEFLVAVGRCGDDVQTYVWADDPNIESSKYQWQSSSPHGASKLTAETLKAWALSLAAQGTKIHVGYDKAFVLDLEVLEKTCACGKPSQSIYFVLTPHQNIRRASCSTACLAAAVRDLEEVALRSAVVEKTA